MHKETRDPDHQHRLPTKSPSHLHPSHPNPPVVNHNRVFGGVMLNNPAA